MKRFLKYIFLLFLIFITCSLSLNYNVSASETTSILNYDESLGIFKDLTDDEIKEYYQDLSDGLKGDDLLSALQPILKENQVKLNYNSGDTTSTNWNGYYLLERDFVKSPLTEDEISSQTYAKTDVWLNILYSSSDIYVDDSINNGSYSYYDDGTLKSDTFSESKKQFDREHVFPKSFGFNGSNDKYKKFTAGCDMQNLHAGEHNGNSTGHSNYPYGNVKDKSSSTKITSGLTGEIVGYTGVNEDGIIVFEPLDEDKGDIARTIFYMCARYHTYEQISSTDESPALTLSTTAKAGSTIEPSATKDNPAAYGELDDLLEWNEEDPVSEFEIHRNNLCYNAIQYNRNPFIDYPQWANIAFGDSLTGINLDNDLTSNASLNKEVEDTNTMTLSSDSPIVNNYQVDISNISFKIVNEDGEEENVSYTSYVVKCEDTIIEVEDLSNYVFKNSGNYSIIFYYTNENNYTYQYVFEFNIKYNYTLSIDTTNLKIDYGIFEKLDLSNIKVLLYKNNEYDCEITDYNVCVLDSSGSEVSSDGSGIFIMPGDYKVKISYEIDGETIYDTYTISVSPTLTTYIIIGVIVLILVLIFILIIVNGKKKKRRNRRHR